MARLVIRARPVPAEGVGMIEPEALQAVIDGCQDADERRFMGAKRTPKLCALVTSLTERVRYVAKTAFRRRPSTPDYQ